MQGNSSTLPLMIVDCEVLTFRSSLHQSTLYSGNPDLYRISFGRLLGYDYLYRIRMFFTLHSNSDRIGNRDLQTLIIELRFQ
jgi:hypothetical protein